MKIYNFFGKIGSRIKNRSLKGFVKNLWIPLVIIVCVIFADLLTKTIVENNLTLGQSVVLIPKFLSITYVLNEGAAFSMLEGKRWFLIAVTTVAVLILLLYLIYDCDKLTVLMKTAIALLIGGAIGNMVDRLAIGAVRDFIEFIYFGLDLPLLGESFAIFNLADSAVTIGTVLLIIGVIIGHHKKEKQDDKETALEE
ncbi:MAG TPA: signal peptidase II [Clostridiales bacterium]|nr:signal peptidase II [Clostridiales bacterium]